jgi:hypothetical protein
MIIFGWGHRKVEDLGLVDRAVCEHCRNLVDWRLQKVSIWFTLFFAPVFPYQQKYLVVCPICGWGFQLEKDQFDLLEKSRRKGIGHDQMKRLPYTINSASNRICPNCGESLGYGQRQCPKCGITIDWDF